MTSGDRRADEAELRRVIDDWTLALRAKDIERLWTHYTPDVLSFDLAPPLQHGSEMREELEAWFQTWSGPIGYELRDLAIVAGGDVGFSHSLNRLRGKRTDGEETDIWFRATLCFRKVGGSWKVAHEHTSVPFYMDGSYRAAVDLAP
jgi:ketosteroid isomerase-like protein